MDPSLSNDHCLFTTMDGALFAIPLQSKGQGLVALGTSVFHWQTPHKKAISSSPAVANGRVYFGCDDGFLYVLGNGRTVEDLPQPIALHHPRSETTIAGHRHYPWPSAYGGPDNANFIDDPGLKPPFRLRYASHSGGLFKEGSILWRQESVVDRWHVETTSLGPDFLTVNNKYKGGAWRWNLSDGSIARSYDNPIQLWGPSHGCGAIVLASEGFALSATLEGIYAVDCQTGKILWKSPGFASWTCPNPIASNGRIFYCPQLSGVLFCFEPAVAEGRSTKN